VRCGGLKQVEEHFMHHNLTVVVQISHKMQQVTPAAYATYGGPQPTLGVHHLCHNWSTTSCDTCCTTTHNYLVACSAVGGAAGVWTPPAAQLVVDHLFHRWYTTCVTTGLPPVVTLKTTPQLSCGAELHLSLETPQLKVVVMPQDVYCCCAAKHKKVKYNQTKVWLFK